MYEDEYCRLRILAYGLEGCKDCPISCPVAPSNLNVLDNIESLLEEIEEIENENGQNS